MLNIVNVHLWHLWVSIHWKSMIWLARQKIKFWCVTHQGSNIILCGHAEWNVFIDWRHGMDSGCNAIRACRMECEISKIWPVFFIQAIKLKFVPPRCTFPHYVCTVKPCICNISISINMTTTNLPHESSSYQPYSGVAKAYTVGMVCGMRSQYCLCLHMHDAHIHHLCDWFQITLNLVIQGPLLWHMYNVFIQ